MKKINWKKLFGGLKFEAIEFTKPLPMASRKARGTELRYVALGLLTKGKYP